MSLHTNSVAKHSFNLVDARRLILPLGASLMLHAFILWSGRELSPTPGASAARQHNLRASMQQTPAAAPTETHLITTIPSSENTPRRAPEKPVNAPPDKPRASDEITKSPPEREYGEIQPNLPIEPVRNSIDLAGLRQYHLALGRKAQQFRRYPEEARAAGSRGRVTMRLVVSETGSPLGISLLGSSGFPVLDRAALEMMLLSASHTEVPESLRGRSFNIDLAIDYNPDDAP
jgi:protein TonB